MDDSLISTGDYVPEHIKVLKTVLERTRQNRINLKTIWLMKHQVMYAGQIISNRGNYTWSVMHMPEPETIQTVQKLLGRGTYTFKFLDKLSVVT